MHTGEIRMAKNVPSGMGRGAHRVAIAINFKEVQDKKWAVNASGGSVGAAFSTTVHEVLDARKAQATIAEILHEALDTGFAVTKMVMPGKAKDSVITLLGVQAEEATLKLSKDWKQ